MSIGPWTFLFLLLIVATLSYIIGLYAGWVVFGPRNRHISNETYTNEEIEMIIKKMLDRSDSIAKKMKRREKLLDKDGAPIYNKRIVERRNI